jgi:GntR family transcriptional regulator
MIEWRRDLPRWRQVANVLRQRIAAGEYPPGWMITELAIVQEWGIARTTARKSIAWLREQGLIYTRASLGSFVGPEPPDEDDGQR